MRHRELKTERLRKLKDSPGQLRLVQEENCQTNEAAAAIIAAAAGVVMARHGARAITSSCGTVDILEILGIDVECEPGLVQKSIEQAGIGIFNGMSSQIHPRALGRILSRLTFGSVLNIAASLANPVLPTYGVRGVYSESLLHNVPQVMHKIGYEKAFVVCGLTGSGIHRMDEASTLGKTLCAELNSDGSISYMSFYPEDLRIPRGDPALQEAICQAVAEKLKDLRMVELQLREVDYYRSYGNTYLQHN